MSPLTAQRPCHWIALSTDPFAENGGTSTAVLSAPANASNVPIICNISVSKELRSLLTVNGMRTFVLDMNDPNFQLSGGSQLVPILTIVSFGQDLDMAVLECINNGFIYSSQNNKVCFLLAKNNW